jgi:NADH-quinone oxidoreductase subunit I
MLCSRECPDWCIYIESHKDVMPPKTAGARARTRNVLDRFAIDFALCMYCGICVEVCPFDALFWSPHFEYSDTSMDGLIHEKDVLGSWLDLVPPPPELEEGAEPPPELEAPPIKVFEPIGAAAAAPPAASAPAAAAPAQAAAPADAAAPAEAAAPAAEAPAAEAPAAEAQAAEAAPAAEVDHTPPEVDEEAYQRELAAGKPERIARAMAKKAWILKRRKGGA